MLTSKQRSYLRGLAAKEDTILQIGKDGITENTTAALSDALRARELVKGRVLENSLLTAREAIEILSERCRAEQVQVIGSKFVLYKRNESSRPSYTSRCGPRRCRGRAARRRSGTHSILLRRSGPYDVPRPRDSS